MNSINFEGWVEVSPTRWKRETTWSSIEVEVVDGEVEVNVHTFANGSDAVSTGVSIPIEIIRRIIAT